MIIVECSGAKINMADVSAKRSILRECVIRAKNNVVQSNPVKTDSFGGAFSSDSFRGAFNSVLILTGYPCSEAGSYDDICT